MDFQTKTTFLSIDYWLNCKSRGEVSNVVDDVYQNIKLLDDIDGETSLVDKIASICLFIRDHYQGLDQQKLSIWMILEMEAYFPCFGSSMVEILPKFGCWKDLNLLLLEINNSDKWAYQYLEQTIYHHIQTVFNKDLEALHNNSLLDNHQITNLVKFIGKEKRGLDRKIGFAKKFVKLNYREEYQYSPAKALQHYRQDCRALMTYINNYKPIVNIKVNPLVNLSQPCNNGQIKTMGPGQDFVFDIVKQTRRYTQNEYKFRQKYIENQLDCYLNDLHYQIPERVHTRLDNLESYKDEVGDEVSELDQSIINSSINQVTSLPYCDYLSCPVESNSNAIADITTIPNTSHVETTMEPTTETNTSDFWKSYLKSPLVNIPKFNSNTIPIQLNTPLPKLNQDLLSVSTQVDTTSDIHKTTKYEMISTNPINIPNACDYANNTCCYGNKSSDYADNTYDYADNTYDYANNTYDYANNTYDYANNTCCYGNNSYNQYPLTSSTNYQAYNTGEYPNYYDNSYYNYYYNMYTPSNLVNNYNSASHGETTNLVNDVVESYQTCQKHDGYQVTETSEVRTDQGNENYTTSADILYQIDPKPYQPDENDDLIDFSHICESTIDPMSVGGENTYHDSSTEDEIPELISISMSNDSEDYWDDPMDIDQSEYDIMNESKLIYPLPETCQVFNEPIQHPETQSNHCEDITNLSRDHCEDITNLSRDHCEAITNLSRNNGEDISHLSPKSKFKSFTPDMTYLPPKIITFTPQDIPIITEVDTAATIVNEPENVICEITHKYDEYWKIMVEALVKRDKQAKIASIKASFRTYQQAKASNTIKKYLRSYLEKQANDPDAFVFVDDKDFVC